MPQNRPYSVLVDPGHGGKDYGAIGPDGEREKDVNLALGKLFRDMVNGGDYLYRVYSTRCTDRYVTLESRCQKANDLQVDLFLSFHLNACDRPSAEGVEVWYCTKSEKGKAFAAELYLALLGSMPGISGRGIKRDCDSPHGSLYVLRHTFMPAALIEFEFISNPRRYAMDPADQARIVRGLAETIELFLESGELG